MNVLKLTVILMLMLGVFPARGSAEFLYGEVAEVNRALQEFVLISIPTKQGETKRAENNSRINVKAVGELFPQSEEGLPLLPGCVQVGEKVRVWGETPATGSVFLAIDVRGCGGMGCNDSTGVRSRLQKYKKRKHWNQETEADVAPSSVSEEADNSDIDGGGSTGRSNGRGYGTGNSGNGNGGGSGGSGGGGGGRGR